MGAQWRQFSYLRYGAHLSLGQICAERADASGSGALPQECQQHFEESHKSCPRAEPLVHLASAMKKGSQEKLDVLQRAQAVAGLENSTGHCALYAEPRLYADLPRLLAEAHA